MKTLAAELAFFFRGKARQNLKFLAGYIGFLVTMLAGYSFLFHYIMLRFEDRDFSFITSVYWTITVMTTLGFGDITFHTDAGRAFAGIVTLSGVVFLLIVLPFGLISLFIAPWMEQRLRRRLTEPLPADIRDHVIIAGWNPVSFALVKRLDKVHVESAVVIPDHAQAARLEEGGVRVIYGSPGNPDVLDALRVREARAVVANLRDADNANIALTVKSVADTPVVAVADNVAQAELLYLAGASHVIGLNDVLGRNLAVRSTTKGALSHVIGSYGDLLFAEVPLTGSAFVGRSIREAALSEKTGVSVAGLWDRGQLDLTHPDIIISERAVVVLVATREQLERLETLLGGGPGDDSVLIIGHGSVGCAAADFLQRIPVSFRLVDLDPGVDCRRHSTIVGDATSPAVLKEAGVEHVNGIVVSTNDDGVNVLLTLACRMLNPTARLVVRSNKEENVREIYAAGADFVVSRASVGAAMIMGALSGRESVVVTEGVRIFWEPVPASLVGVALKNSRIRNVTGASVVSLVRPDHPPLMMPPADTILPADATMIFVGHSGSQDAFLGHYGGLAG